MAASQTLPQFSSSHKSAISTFGVLTIHGFGLRVRMQSGHLEIEDGIGPERRKFRLPRVGHGLKRLVCVSEDGFVTLSALKWLADQRASFVMLDRLGKVLITTGPVSPSDARLRRAQGLAHHSGAALAISRELIHQKIAGQEKVVREKIRNTSVADVIARFQEKLDCVIDLDEIRAIESRAAKAYWSAWQALPVSFPTNCLSKIPEHWKIFGTRESPLTGSPRLAANPVNAMLNYVYAVLESESRLALAVVGLDPGLGVLHKDTVRRDSLACDLMEVVRPKVDTFLFDWFVSQRLRREWFVERSDGSCRLTTSIVERLSETAITWHRAVAPWAEWIAHALWSTTATKQREKARPTHLTQNHRREVKGGRLASTDAVPKPETICQSCGASIRRGTKFCRPCSLEVATSNMIEIAKMGRVRTQMPDAQTRRAATQVRQNAAAKAWAESSPVSTISEADYVKKIQPLLLTVSNSAIASALGISLPYAADIRRSKRRPHPRHWQALAELVESLGN